MYVRDYCTSAITQCLKQLWEELIFVAQQGVPAVFLLSTGENMEKKLEWKFLETYVFFLH